MPVIIVGADTPAGRAIVDAVLHRAGEVRAFVTDAAVAETLRSKAVKVALGDISDASHLGGAALGCFSAVLVAEAAFDGREMAFVTRPERVVESWIDAVIGAGVTRVVLVEDSRSTDVARALESASESAIVDPTGLSIREIADRVVALDDADSL